MFEDVTLIILLILAVFFTIAIINFVLMYFYRTHITEMNRDIVRFDSNGWLVLINVNHRVVGLYYNSHAVSHARIHLSKKLLDQIKSSEVFELTIGDFRNIDAQIPRYSYRALYEYQVPHETRVIVYKRTKDE